MTQFTPQRRGVPIWAQIIVWVFLVALLVIVAMGLRRAQQGTVQPGQKIDNFTLPLYSGYEYEGNSEVSLDDLHGKVVVMNFWASGASLASRKLPSCSRSGRNMSRPAKWSSSALITWIPSPMPASAAL